jgi:3',5'-nucleoside bisphosphate phosphatase
VTDSAVSQPDLTGFIDLHSHTTASDGSYSPADLMDLAQSLHLDAISITDHDTFDGYHAALPLASVAGVRVVCGIELSTSYEISGGKGHRNLHLLAYFPLAVPGPIFMEWLNALQSGRRERNVRLVKALQGRGIDIALDEVEAIGRSVTGRPHFSRVLIAKGYATDTEDAFRRYLGEGAPTFIERDSPRTAEMVSVVRSGGGVPVVAHPIRLSISDPKLERRMFEELKAAGLLGIETIHSDHSPERQAYYANIARELDLIPTGGSDFHGSVKPKVAFGRGIDDNVRVPSTFLKAMTAQVGSEVADR